FTIKNDLIEKLKKKKLISIRQKKKLYYHPNGAAIYITKISKINKYIIGGKITYYLMKEENSIDIDTNYDFKLAELVKKLSL
ncbi:hypothetical protein OAY24_00005, partial [Candidatus Pelagibacter sp.]|nr:hypothetical protein [Candidatus Pelagibacter sp.]